MRPLPEIDHDARFQTEGPDVGSLAALDDVTLLGLMLTRGPSCADPHGAASRLFARFGSLAAIASADLPELARVGGVGPVALTDLKLLRLLCERLARCEAARRPVVSSWSALLAYLRLALAEEPREQFRALFLDRKNQLLRDEMVGHGTIDHAPVYPREIVRRALDLSAASIILVHNHPSGDPTPSQADIVLTRKILAAAKLFDIAVHDHLIIGRDGTTSLRNAGLIP